MSLRKVWFFAMATIFAFAAAQPANKSGRAHQVTASPETSEMASSVVLPVQSKNVKHLGAGKLLVASRNLADPNFARTVVLLVDYDAEGVMGLILNRRTDLPLSRVLHGLKAAKDRSDRVYLGGPVQTPAVFALLQSATKLEGAKHIFGGVYLISSKTLLEQTMSARPDPGVFHVYLGYAGWSNSQLRKEVERGAWYIFQADAGTVFDSDPDSLWSQMIRKTELEAAESEPADATSLAAQVLHVTDLHLHFSPSSSRLTAPATRNTIITVAVESLAYPKVALRPLISRKLPE
jgi:putative transcriptional regulator